ncbi:MAG: TldD/PmbA family protein [Candidatus Bathyarchaeota archaeon]|uniref:TldD/PmbA family protein n=1 Tax=Candidatus Bathycorpusculum sp. TaxID=2994959 RepID=UPI00283009DC|nr:TldD/PmbA family protein [Candidatus Termiticorpusculum sp.]MCL2256892.1 TldD/PmbA family protein [Candidatus Termiticorpusculum sp.]MCL2292996.1 TldD/PmbA family protein [Candidatus Termiticorpusculum sp.]
MAVLEKNEMLTIAEKTVQLATAKGACEAEVYVYEEQASNVGIEFGQVNKTDQIIDRGIGVRVIVNKTVGFAYTNIINDPSTLEAIVVQAISAAKASKPDSDWLGFVQKKPYAPKLNGTFDSKILELCSEELVTLSQNMLDSAVKVDKAVLAAEGGIGKAYFSNAIVNSNGVYGFDRGTFIECSLATLAKDGNKVTPVCFEFNAARNYNVDPVWVGREAANLSVSALKTKKPIKTQTMSLILTQFALQELLGYTLFNAVKADSVQRGQSPFKGKIGEKIVSENITIYDDGLYPGGMRTGLFDDEGTPHQKTLLIDKGVLKTFLYDNYTAKKEGKESTGNAARAGYLSTPNIGTTNFHIMPKTTLADDMLLQVDNGLLVYYLQGAHSSNPVSGDFSVVATPVWKIQHGEIVFAARDVMLAGNIFEVLKNVKIVGNNERQVGGLIAPWIMVDNVRVIGK